MILHVTDAVGFAAAILTTICWLPQALKTIRERETKAISLPGTVLFTVGTVLWGVYGLAIVDWPLIGSSLITGAAMAVILGLKLAHG